MDEMNKMMRMLTGMNCLMSMDKHLRSNAEHLKNLKELENPQTRMDRLILSMYEKCKNNGDGLTGIADMIGGKKEQKAPDVAKMYEGLNIPEILADDTPELNEEEKVLLAEFKEIEEERKKYQEEAKKHAEAEKKA